jgi:hypothetical protein
VKKISPAIRHLIEKTVGTTSKPQPAKKTGSTHLRPNGKECQYFGSPPLCMKCGSLLDPMPHAEDCDLDDCACGAEA